MDDSRNFKVGDVCELLAGNPPWVPETMQSSSVDVTIKTVFPENLLQRGMFEMEANCIIEDSSGKTFYCHTRHLRKKRPPYDGTEPSRWDVGVWHPSDAFKNSPLTACPDALKKNGKIIADC